jgi:uridylate kinase
MKYSRILLKMSGEALMGSKQFGIDEIKLENYCRQIAEISAIGIETGIVIGGGNIFRGVQGTGRGFERVKGDYMGMLATAINGMAIQSFLDSMGMRSKHLTALSIDRVGELFCRQKAIESLSKKEIGIYSCGTGNPYFTTDTASALRAIEVGADVLLKGTRVDGVYSADPEKFPDARKFEVISFEEAIQKELKIMDLTAFTLCSENNLPVLVFNINTPGNLKKIVTGEKIGTLVRNY